MLNRLKSRFRSKTSVVLNVTKLPRIACDGTVLSLLAPSVPLCTLIVDHIAGDAAVSHPITQLQGSSSDRRPARIGIGPDQNAQARPILGESASPANGA